MLMYSFFTQGSLSNEMLMSTLEAVDIVMIANLVKMIIVGSYTSFVDKTHEEGEHTSSGALKVKMASSILGVSSVHLLQTFINSEHVSMETIYKQLMIHGIFIVGTIVLATVDYLHNKTQH